MAQLPGVASGEHGTRRRARVTAVDGGLRRSPAPAPARERSLNRHDVVVSASEISQQGHWQEGLEAIG